jgi:hypothetical protein
MLCGLLFSDNTSPSLFLIQLIFKNTNRSGVETRILYLFLKRIKNSIMNKERGDFIQNAAYLITLSVLNPEVNGMTY